MRRSQKRVKLEDNGESHLNKSVKADITVNLKDGTMSSHHSPVTTVSISFPCSQTIKFQPPSLLIIWFCPSFPSNFYPIFFHSLHLPVVSTFSVFSGLLFGDLLHIRLEMFQIWLDLHFNPL